MTTRTQAPEKIAAVAGIYQALLTELPISSVIPDPEVVAALIDASVKIAMGTDTRDMGLLAPAQNGSAHPEAHGVTAKQLADVAVRGRAAEIAAEMACDDCGRTDGTHDPDVEH